MGQISEHELNVEGDENARLRLELQQSRSMLARYTEQLAAIMPGMQRLLQDTHQEQSQKGPTDTEQQAGNEEPCGREMLARYTGMQRLLQDTSQPEQVPNGNQEVHSRKEINSRSTRQP